MLVLPYRHPLYWARVAASIEQLAKGRLIMGVGVGWMREEFAALGVPFAERGRMTDEQLEIVEQLWTQEHITYDGQHYQIQDVAFYPKPLRQPRIPIWVGGEGAAAQRRAARYGDAWFPYFVTITPAELHAGYDNVRRLAATFGRGPDAVKLTCCRPIELTREPVPQDDEHLRGTAEQLVAALANTARSGSSTWRCNSWRRAGRSASSRSSASPVRRCHMCASVCESASRIRDACRSRTIRDTKSWRLVGESPRGCELPAHDAGGLKVRRAFSND